MRGEESDDQALVAIEHQNSIRSSTNPLPEAPDEEVENERK